MTDKNKQIEIIKAKARGVEKEEKPVTVGRPVFNIKTHKMEVGELVLKAARRAIRLGA